MPDPLKLTLQTWDVRVSPDANFHADVWRRIAAHEGLWLDVLKARFAFYLSQPAWAAAAVFAMLIAGLSAGNWWQQQAEQRERIAGAVAYMQAVNPVARSTMPER